MIKIRPAKIEDCKSCHELSKVPELRTPHKDEPPLYWFQNIVKEKQILLVAEENKKIIGFIMGERIVCDWTALHLLAVNPYYRSKGIGRKLIEAYEKECRKRKLHGILTYVHSNIQTINFFKRNKYSLGSTVIEAIKEL